MTSPPVAEVAAVFEGYPRELRARLLELRAIVLETAASLPEIGEIEETLRWGEPAYLTPSRSGSTVRLGPVRGAPDEFALFFNCQTSLVETFRQWFPRGLRFEGNRSVVFRIDEPLPTEEVTECIAAALTYHRRQRSRPG